MCIQGLAKRQHAIYLYKRIAEMCVITEFLTTVILDNYLNFF